MTQITHALISLPSIDFDEMAFAMAFFEGSVRGRVSLPVPKTEEASKSLEILNDDPERDSLRTILELAEHHPTDDEAVTFALAMLWHHYQGDERQQSICSRLMAFHSLLTQMVDPSSTQNLASFDGVASPYTLTPIIQTAASAALNQNSHFEEASFPDLVAARETSLEGKTRRAPAVSYSSVPSTIKGSAWEFAKLLYIFETCALTPMEQANFLRFGVLRKLFVALSQIGGWRASQLILSRSIASLRLEFPWLAVAEVPRAGVVKWPRDVRQSLTPHQAVEGELALVGTLVKSLQSVLGDDVTANLLKSVWPLASFRNRSNNLSPI